MVDEAARDAVAAGDLPGVVILVGQGDRILYRKALGSRAVLPGVEPLTLDTVFDVASLTKVLATTPAILALWEQGRLDLDAPVDRYLGELPQKAYRGVTIRRVLTHSDGLPDPPPPRALMGLVHAEAFRRVAQVVAKGGLDFTPGTTFRYGDTGFMLLGEVVRRVAGEPLDEFMRGRFFGPLGMTATRFRPPDGWRPRIAPTDFINGRWLRGEVHDGHARLLGGVAGHAGLFASADDLARFCRMLLAGGTLGGRRYLKASTVQTMLEPRPVGDSLRAFGWDSASSYSRVLGSYFPMGSIGHTGFTGTAVWMDPASRAYLIILSSRLHPKGENGSVRGIRRRVAAAVGAQLFGGGDPPPAVPSGDPRTARIALTALRFAPTRTGLDRLVAGGFAPLAGRSVGLVTNQTGVDDRGRRGIDLLAAAPNVKLRVLFSPEHGLSGQLDSPVPHGRDAATGLPVWSLYGADRHPSPSMLEGIDTLVFDVQDVGVRYYTYLATLVYILEEGARRNIPVVVLDRPNPITGRVVEGPLMDADLRSFTAPHPIPVRTGMTIGEFARMVVAERRLPVSLTVIPLEGWDRGRWFEETGLPWVNPSPNIRSPLQALLYSGVGILESTNLSVGRGTDTPFEVIGAPWITDPPALAEALEARALPGVRFHPVSFVPSASEYAGEALGGVRLVVTDREAIRPVKVGLTVATVLRERYPAQFRPAAMQDLLVNRSTVWAFVRGEPLARIFGWAEAELAAFLQRRAAHLLYR